MKAKLIRQQIGIKFGGENISMIHFADDIVILTECEEDLLRAINEMVETLKTFKIKIMKKYVYTNLCKKTPKHNYSYIF